MRSQRLPLTREVDFAKQKTEGENNTFYAVYKTIFVCYNKKPEVGIWIMQRP